MKLQERFSLLTPREREAFPFIVSGLLNKQSAAILGVSEITIRIHRGRVMRKMEATSFAELVRMAVKLKVPNWRGPRLCARTHGCADIALFDSPPWHI